MPEENTVPTSDATETNTAATEEPAGTQDGAEPEAKVVLTRAELEAKIASAVTARLAQERRQRQKEAAQKDLPEAERLKTELADLRAENLRYRTKDEFFNRARELKLDNAQKCYELYGGRLEFDDKDRCTNLDQVLQQAKSDIAEILRGSGNNSREKVDASARSTGPGHSGSDVMNAAIRQLRG